MANPTSMTEETLDGLKGWTSEHALDFEAGLASSDRYPRGAVVHVNSSGNFAFGCNDTALNPMPLFLIQASDDPDVQDADAPDPSTKKRAYVPIRPTGKASALVATGAYELRTTNFVSGSYSPNDPLTSPTSGNNKGKLTSGTIDTDVVCGLVSRGVIDNGYGFNALSFWPTWFPKVT